MISKFDDYPIHQSPEPIAHTATSDRFTYDRYWYNGHTQEGDLFFGIAMGRYPNLGILDCAFSIVVDGHQHAFYGSRRAPNEPSETTVGPFSITILEPMGRHRVVIEPNETGIECDLIFTPRTAAIEEGRQTKRNSRYLIQDVTRFDQFGFWQGVVRYQGKEINLQQRVTYGLKDRSWGIRQVGERYTGGAPLKHTDSVHFLWAPIHWQERCTLAGCYEDGDGYQWHNDQVIVPSYSTRDQIPAEEPGLIRWRGVVKHQLNMASGTRRAQSAIVTMADHGGDTLELQLEPILTFRMKGIGYQHSEWGHGLWKGELAIGSESWACDDIDPLTWDNIHIQQLVKARSGDQIGYGVLEQMNIGPYLPYGLTSWFDGAK
ncbi:hypothetical protein [Halioxenophilus sp. WMMB6]|uniref:hypothetical protein n=1 Tax=Halioxenophilus sp. WMMB6 TaxID=3073815 RepID=UPI00295E9106|nr:hypothetical protein [Halioxenophilus sp. WMMB6]